MYVIYIMKTIDIKYIHISRTNANTGYRFKLKFNNSESVLSFINRKYYIFVYYYIYLRIIYLHKVAVHNISRETRRADKNIFDSCLSRVLSRVSRIGRRRAREANRGEPENFTAVFLSRP